MTRVVPPRSDRILALLREHPMTVNEIAQRLGTHKADVHVEMKLLEADGVIQHYGAVKTQTRPAALWGIALYSGDDDEPGIAALKAANIVFLADLGRYEKPPISLRFPTRETHARHLDRPSPADEHPRRA